MSWCISIQILKKTYIKQTWKASWNETELNLKVKVVKVFHSLVFNGQACSLVIFRKRPGGAQMATCPSVEQVTCADGTSCLNSLNKSTNFQFLSRPFQLFGNTFRSSLRLWPTSVFGRDLFLVEWTNALVSPTWSVRRNACNASLQGITAFLVSALHFWVPHESCARKTESRWGDWRFVAFQTWHKGNQPEMKILWKDNILQSLVQKNNKTWRKQVSDISTSSPFRSSKSYNLRGGTRTVQSADAEASKQASRENSRNHTL